MKITIKNLQKKLPIHAVKIRKLIQKILKGENIRESGWINICFVNDPFIKKFNAKFHKTNSSTDVLAFNLSEKILLADIMISTDTAIRQAAIFKTSADYELSLYVAHGILHILGYNDQKTNQAKLMRKKEAQYVNR
ncbi:MAG: rRNA maturation RNase YbeY [Candidatus Omnitrophica bacterium]|nr:rRNA maturation RNase YbeY [Candidatus Omnitrophota bacterium]MDD5661365.1 rRNA maturation RNase YbeY [Candidatus Omnitrophota bacterium]